jgi:hypothetical protein
MDNSISKNTTKTAITCTKVSATQFQKDGTLTAELKQVLTTVSSYPSTKVTSSKEGNIFGAQEFGFTPKDFTSKETRVAWIPVPIGTTVEQVMAKLQSFPGACLYKEMSNHPILTDEQRHAIDNPELPSITIDTFAMKQIVRYSEGHEKAGQVALTNEGKVQYRRIFFSPEVVEDIDTRNTNTEDQYVPAEIQAELGLAVDSFATQSSAPNGQTF